MPAGKKHIELCHVFKTVSWLFALGFKQSRSLLARLIGEKFSLQNPLGAIWWAEAPS